ncbi:unnamed protein product [Prorocentrum cordatum]|uniref:Mei2-like C-terminal RNA recognition motif domain-containing protein n=1 Tax=Prorocentrum cordatum TaxID=2364126 RepID=A0ABN9WL99_9DINO|nr:unnamed protein product [Polarella glacialis]
MAAAPAALMERPEHPSPAASGQRASAPGAAQGAARPWPSMLGGLCSWRVVVRNTFLHVQDAAAEDMALRSLRTSSSAPALLSPWAGPGVPIGEPPSPRGAERRTTVMFRNVPYVFTRDMFVELLNSQGFRGQFNLVYVPMDFKTNQTRGYAFANAISHGSALRLFGAFEGFRAWPQRSSKVCSVCWSTRQGLDRNVEAYRNLEVMQANLPDAWKPALFSEAGQVPFPEPTRKVTRNCKKLCGTGGAPQI